MKKILVSGSYDYLHYWHLQLLKRAREMGDYLIVMLSTDEFNKQKGKKTHMPYEQRKKILEELRCVDLVVPETSHDHKKDVVIEHNVDIYCVGDDWLGTCDWLKKYCNVIYLTRTPDISSTQIKEGLGDE